MKYRRCSINLFLALFRISAVIALILMPCIPSALAGQATLTWDTNTEPDLAGYKLHYGEASGIYTVHLDVHNATNYMVTGLLDGKKYYFALTAYDASANESGFSSEVVYSVPDINLAGNGQNIANGDATPSSADGTDFGNVSLASGTLTRNFSLQNLGTSALNLTGTPKVSVTGAHAADFTVSTQPGSPVPAGGNVTFQVTFDPSLAGLRTAILNIASDDQDETTYTFYIQGTGFTPTETVAAPAAPVGAASGFTQTSYAYTGSGSTSSSGDPVQYQFDWGDGTTSAWLAVGATIAAKSWTGVGIYPVKVKARCATHTTVESAWSSSLAVSIIKDATAPAAPKGFRISFLRVVNGKLQVTLAWDPVVDPSPAGYLIHYGTASGRYGSTRNPGLATTFTITSLRKTSDYYFVATSCALNGLESENSNEVHCGPGVLPLFSDDFRSSGPLQEPNWRVVSNEWSVAGTHHLTNSPVSRNMAVVSSPELADFASGRIESLVKLSDQYETTPNAAIIFSYAKGQGYRYVRINSSGIAIGQAGSDQTEARGVKAVHRQEMETAKWYHLRVDVEPSGLVSVYLDHATEPVATYNFAALRPGKVGYRSENARAYFDNLMIWDGRVSGDLWS